MPESRLPPPGALETEAGGERLWLLPDRAAYWPRTETLLVADAHLGKAAAFRREGVHLCAFPYAGRHVHSGLAALAAWRLGQRFPLTFSMAFNDYGFELLSPTAYEIDDHLVAALFARASALPDLLSSINAAELARRHFREIARVTGLVFQGYPGDSRSAKQLQITSGLLYDVYARHDPGNPLLAQAKREVLDRELELPRLEATLDAIAARRIVLVRPKRLTPLGLPLVAEQMRNSLSTEKLATRVERLQLAMQKPEKKPRGKK